jgi:hypothetical protein
MLNIDCFDKTTIPTSIKLASHVLWFNADESTVEVVSTFLRQPVESGFEDLKHRVDSYLSNSKLDLSDFDAFNVVEAGCNVAIFKVVFTDNCSYQLNFVEIV